jgi:hypothetical protein
MAFGITKNLEILQCNDSSKHIFINQFDRQIYLINILNNKIV